jgi:uroporphyrin-3 C-methyltransferase
LHELQNKKQGEALTQQLTSLNTASEQRLSQLISQQQTALENQVSTALADITNTSDTRIKQLEAQISALQQNQPSDWLIHEAEYLIRIASRSIVLNKNPTAAIDSLKEADLRVKELDEFQYFNIRKLIREDIETLKAMPLLDTNETVLSLLALNKRIESLTLAWVDKKEMPVEVSELTDNIDDWKENLKITWDNFVNDYFTLRPINANIQPLLSPEYQQNLKENLSLKVQLAIWATTEENQEVYLQSIADIEEWIQKYFDMEKRENLTFYKNIEALKNNIISSDYTVNLLSLKEIRKYLIDKPIESIKAPVETQNSTEGIESNTPRNTSKAISSVKEEI